MTVEHVYPAGPSSVPPDLTRSTQTYRLHAWLAMAGLAYTWLQQARWQEAIEPLDVALKKTPSSMGERIAMDTLRVRRMLSYDGKAPAAGLERHSAALKYYATLESGAGLEPGTDTAYYHLGHGDPNLAAKEVARSSEPVQRILRLAAASDGADPELIAAALALPITEGIDADTVLASLALAMREQADAEAYITAFRDTQNPDAQRVLDFISIVRQGGSAAEAEQLLNGVDVTVRAQAYSAALVLRGKHAPKEWRIAANRLLFIPERPYFVPANPEITAGRDSEPGVVRTPPRLAY